MQADRIGVEQAGLFHTLSTPISILEGELLEGEPSRVGVK
jgi:hypothetical protein